MKLTDKFIGIPFVSGGRSFTGADCWGVAVLYYKEYLNIDLPSFTGEYETTETLRVKELIARHREGWQRVTKPKTGDLILFKVLGSESHVGIYLGNNEFLHALENQASVVQNLNSPEWSRRVVGYYAYKEKIQSSSKEILPSALETKQLYCEVPEGTTIASFIEEASKIAKVPYSTFAEKFSVYVNNTYIDRANWQEYRLITGDLVEYRLVSEKSALRIVFITALVLAGQAWAASLALPTAGAAAAGAAIGAATAAPIGFAMAKIGIALAASLLVNAIFPVRPPDAPLDPGTAKAQYLFNGGSNPISKYQAIPVVLGKVRITAPHAANPYVYNDTDISYLRMLLCWGYGPLKIEDISVGTTSIDEYIQQSVTYNDVAHGSGQRTAAFELYGGGSISDFEQKSANIKLVSDGTTSSINSPWYEYEFAQEVSSIDVTFNFPQGLRQLKVKGTDAGKVYGALFNGVIEYRPAGTSVWSNAVTTRHLTNTWSNTFTAPYFTTYTTYTDWEGTSNLLTTVYLYQWHVVAVAPTGVVKVFSGTPSQSQNEPANASTIALLNSNKYGTPNSRPPLVPVVPEDYAPLFKICVKSGEAIFGSGESATSGIGYERVAYENIRDTVNWGYTGLIESWGLGLWTNSLNSTPNYVSISTGSISSSGSSTQYIQLGELGSAFYKRKDPFSYTKRISLPSKGRYEVRTRRINNSETNPGGNEDFQNFHDAYLTTITGTLPGVPVIEPKNSKLALTAINIQATDQLNGSIEGINALVTTIALDYNSATNTWGLNETNNPASLFRYVLEHPANAQRVKGDLSSQVHVEELQEWHKYCKTNGFAYNDIVTGQKSILDVLRDIASAGRASPLMKDGKWTVVVDKPRPYPVQYFTPHNSWGFESVKALPKQPDAFRVVFPNEQKNYQEDEIICYNTGKNAANSELYEELTLPGITNSMLAARHARWHLAQLKLRPELYSFNTDMEYLVCTRGDMVRVAHDVPMWGTATGRVEKYINSTSISLSEDVYLQIGKTYVIRIRLANGTSVARQLPAVSQSNYYRTITLTSALSASEGAAGNLFMIGELEKETQELIVLSIEPSTNYTARLTLVDYSPSLYTIEEIDNTTGEAINYPFPDFNSNLTLPAKNLIKNITQVPEIQDIKSDESVLGVLSPGVFVVNMVAGFITNTALPEGVKYIEVHAKLKETPDTTSSWNLRNLVEIPGSFAKFSDLIELQEYTLRSRYVSSDGRVGPWSSYVDHVVIGKTTKPSTVQNFNAIILQADAIFQAKWNSNPEPDISYYEIRSEDTNWGLSGYVWRGSTTQVDLPVSSVGSPTTYYLRAVDYNGNYSAVSASITKTVISPISPTNLQYKYSTSPTVTSKTNSTVTITWTAATKPENSLEIKEYALTITRPNNLPIETVAVTGTSYTTRADWVGDAQLSIRTIDVSGNQSTSALLFITKLPPMPVSGVTSEVVDNNVFLRWNLPTTTSLPVSHVVIKRGNNWNAPEAVIGEKSGTFTSIIELSGGSYNYMIAAVDTDSRESEVVTIPATVSQPPDFIFNAEYSGSFTGVNTVLQNSVVETNTGKLLMLVDTAESWSSHFSTRSWASPQAQISAGYPVYAQPGTGPASYKEVFDYGTILANSSITVGFSGSLISGSPSTYSTIETSVDGVAWTSAVVGSSIFATNFRFIRISIVAVKNAPGDLYLLENVRIRLDSKQKTDAGNGIASSGDSLGTIVNFSSDREFIDVVSITVTPGGTTPVISVYDFKDVVLTGTYVLSAGVCTVNVAGHGLETGQRVRLSFTTGLAVNGVYTITKISDNQYTVNINSIASTSGNVSTYPQSMRVYLFNNNGVRQSGAFGWALRGY